MTRKFFLSLIGLLSLIVALFVFFSIYPGQKSGQALADGSWYNTAWLYRKAITISPSEIASSTGETYANFPVLISLASDTNLASFASSTGADILFTKADGTTKLNYQIEQYTSSTGQLVAWVNVGASGLSTTTSTVLYLYFGNASATSSQQNATGTWNSNYAAVYHLGGGGILNLNDSTVNGNNAVSNGNCGGDCNAPVAVTGTIDGGVLFNDSRPITAPSSTSLNITGSLTMETWVNMTSLPAGYLNIPLIYADSSGNNNASYDLQLISDYHPGVVFIQAADNVNGTDFPAYNAGYSSSSFTTSTWYHIAATYNGTQWLTYLNGALVASVSSTVNPPTLANQLDIGEASANGNFDESIAASTTMDEVRISNVARSADWIATEYANESNPQRFYSVGQAQTQNGLPSISSFAANPISFGPGGGTSTFYWNVLNANSIAITPGSFTSSSLSGSTMLSVTSTVLYIFTATNSNGTSTATTTITIDATPPTVPSGLTASAVSSTAISLSWTASTDNVGVAGYNIFRGVTSSGLSEIATSTIASYLDNGLASSTTYYYAVSAYDAVGNTSATSTVANATTLMPGSTIITVSSTVDVANAKSFGINLGNLDYWDAGQMLKNLIHNNPGFEGQIYQSILPCAVTSGANDCQDAVTDADTTYDFDTWPNNWWAGATYEVITGQAAGRTGTIVSSVTPADCGTAYACGPTDLTLSPGTPAIGVGDYIVIRRNVNDISVPASQNTQSFTPVEGWWTTANGVATTSVDTTDLASSSPGTQALQINALGAGNSFDLTSYFDTGIASRTTEFIKLNGIYQLQFKAKGLGGANMVNVTVGRTGYGNYLDQNVSLSTSTWQTYTYDLTANENGTEAGSAYVTFTVSSTDMYIDDASLEQIDTDPSNTSVFNDATVDALKALHPGILRDWDLQSGDSLDDAIAPQFARKTTHFSTNFNPGIIDMGLNDFLQLSKVVGAEPWYDIPSNWDPADVTNLMEFLGGNGSTTYGAMRIALNGTTTPWTNVFPQMHFEFGNENWNVGTFPGGVIGDVASYAQRGDELFSTAKSSPYYSSSKFQFILGAQYVDSVTASTIVANATHEDAISEAPYFAYEISSTTASNGESLYGQLFDEIEFQSHGTSTKNTQLQNVQAIAPVPIVDYEENVTTFGSSITQPQLSSFIPSLGAGLALGDHMLMQLRDLGIVDQAAWNLTQYSFTGTYNGVNETAPMFGEAIDPDNEGLVRPTFLAEELANDAIGTNTNVLTTTQTGDNPTWTQSIDYYSVTVPSATAHYIQAYAFSNGNLVLFNLNRSSTLSIKLAGSPLPNGDVTVKQLTSANITDNNESNNTVQITSNNYTNFDPTQTITLPPYSMTDYLQNENSADTSPPSTPTGVTATTASASEIDLSWTNSTDNVGVAGYDIFQCVGFSCTPNTLISTSLGTSYSDIGLVASTTYRYAISAFDAAGNVSPLSSVTSATTQSPDTTPPSAPTSFMASVASANEIDLSWASSTDNVGVAGYIISQGLSTSTIGEIATTTHLSYAATGLAAANTYYYEVAAYDAAGNISASSSVASGTTQSAPASPPGSSGGGIVQVGGGGGGGGGSYYISPTPPPLVSSSSSGSSSNSGGSSGAGNASALASLISSLRSLALQLFASANNGRPLTIGDRGTDIWALQVFLSIGNYGPASAKLAEVGPTGYFGSLTQSALAEFQASVGLPATGYCGALTEAELKNLITGGAIGSTTGASNTNSSPITASPSLVFGDTGSSVTALQKILIEEGYLSAPSASGIFDPTTLRAVETFQCFENIACSSATPGYGTVGPKTRTALGL